MKKNQKLLRNLLHSLQEDLQRDKCIESPVLYIKTKKSEIIKVKPNVEDEIKIRDLCRRVRAKETIYIAHAFSHEDCKCGLLIMGEDKKSFCKVSLLYDINPDGTLEFGEEDWLMESKKDVKEFGTFEDLVR